MKDDEKDGMATYRWAEGAVAVVQYRGGEPIGEGARWSADRRRAYRLEAGRKVERISLEKAAKIAKEMGLRVPDHSDVVRGGARAIEAAQQQPHCLPSQPSQTDIGIMR